MKKLMLHTVMLLTMLLAACTPRIYGVPQDRWETMSEQERIAAMDAYKARQEVLRQQREEQARLRAIEKKAQLAREAEEAHRRQLQIDAIYRGKGLYGDLLRVNLQGGKLQFYGDHKPYQPVAFRIAASETKEVEIVSNRGHRVRMAVFYDGSNLLLDERPHSNRLTALQLPYEDRWEAGATYEHVFSKGPLELRGVDVTVQIIGKPPRDHHARRHNPKATAVRPPVHKHRKPDAIMVKPQPAANKPVKTIAHRPAHTPKAAAHATGPPSRIKVVFRKGNLKLKMHRDPLIPKSIVLKEGEVRNVVMRSRNGALEIQVSYMKGELLINDTPGRGKEHTRLGFKPGWKAGQSYSVRRSHNHLLEDLDIVVTAQ